MSIRLATRAVLLHQGRLLLVNAWADAAKSDLWCAPGGGAEPGASLPDNLAREVFEETGLRINVGLPCLINEFHDPTRGFHQVEVFFRCTCDTDIIDPDWTDPEGVVTRHLWASAQDMAALRVKPSSLALVAFSPQVALSYDALEWIQR